MERATFLYITAMWVGELLGIRVAESGRDGLLQGHGASLRPGYSPGPRA